MYDYNKFKKDLFANEPYAVTASAISNPLVKKHFFEDDKHQRYDTCYECIMGSIYYGEIIRIDPSLDNIIYDTTPLEGEIKLPYDNFFINKFFIHEDFAIAGIAFRKTEYGTIVIMPFFNIDKNNFGNFDCGIQLIRADYFVYGIDKIDIIDSDFTDLDKKIEKRASEYMKTVLKFIANVLILLTMKNKDIKYIKINPSNKKLKTFFGEYNPISRPITHIRITGEIKRYINIYNKAKKSRFFKKSMIVSGYWKEYKSERYTKMRGQKQFIAPYIKGDGKEIMHKFIMISE